MLVFVAQVSRVYPLETSVIMSYTSRQVVRASVNKQNKTNCCSISQCIFFHNIKSSYGCQLDILKCFVHSVQEIFFLINAHLAGHLSQMCNVPQPTNLLMKPYHVYNTQYFNNAKFALTSTQTLTHFYTYLHYCQSEQGTNKQYALLPFNPQTRNISNLFLGLKTHFNLTQLIHYKFQSLKHIGHRKL